MPSVTGASVFNKAGSINGTARTCPLRRTRQSSLTTFLSLSLSLDSISAPCSALCALVLAANTVDVGNMPWIPAPPNGPPPPLSSCVPPPPSPAAMNWTGNTQQAVLQLLSTCAFRIIKPPTHTHHARAHAIYHPHLPRKRDRCRLFDPLWAWLVLPFLLAASPSSSSRRRLSPQRTVRSGTARFGTLLSHKTI